MWTKLIGIIIMVVLVASVIIAILGGMLRNKDLEYTVKDQRETIQSLIVRVNMRNKYLRKIKRYSKTKNGMNKIKSVIFEWDILKETEKAKKENLDMEIDVAGFDLSGD